MQTRRLVESPPRRPLVFCSVQATNPLAGKKYARLGIGGIVILGGGARSSIGGDLAAVLRAAPHGIRPIHRQRRGGRAGPAAARRHLPAAVGPRPGGRGPIEARASRRGLRGAAAQAARRRRVRAGRRPRHPRQVHQRAGPPRSPSDPAVVGSHVLAWVSRAARRSRSSRPSSTGRATAGRRTPTPGRLACPRSRCCRKGRHARLRAGVQSGRPPS